MGVELLEYFGNDDMVCNVARVSYGKIASKYTIEQNKKLIDYLAKHNHWSPFSHPQIQFRITCPIYVERQIFKTQVGVSVNSISGRYVDFSDTYTSISEWRKQAQSSKQGSDGVIDNQLAASQIEEGVIEFCKQAYKQLIDLQVSKEQARSILPLNLNTQFIWTGSLYSFIRLCNLRLKPDAQQETRIVVQQMLEIIKNIEGEPFKTVLSAFGY